jgi:hypothetical protein
MNACFMTFVGTAPEGADVLRERLRWSAAERRWSEPLQTSRSTPTFWPPGRGALPRGAQLTQFTDAGRQRAS